MPRRREHFERGFKSRANSISAQVRLEMGLDLLDRLDPYRLADHLAIPLMPLTELSNVHPEHLHHVTNVEPSVFSAVTVFRGAYRMVVFNDKHPATRQANTITHELSHALLQHPPHFAVDHATGCRVWHDKLESEATFLSGALLITEAAALHLVAASVSIVEASRTYGVSTQLVSYRLNVTGARSRGQFRRKPETGPRCSSTGPQGV